MEEHKIAEVPKLWNTFQGELQTRSVISQAEKNVLQELKLKGAHEAQSQTNDS